jgi:hypothetical protein
MKVRLIRLVVDESVTLGWMVVRWDERTGSGHVPLRAVETIRGGVNWLRTCPVVGCCSDTRWSDLAQYMSRCGLLLRDGVNWLRTCPVVGCLSDTRWSELVQCMSCCWMLVLCILLP